ncbi:MAG: DNA-processing protein DprA [Lachnospiraceae bacterium]|nr:DNA-processing protein DprA [Lachnospiraceae bacterium]
MGNDNIIYVNWIYHIPGIGRTRLRELLQVAGSAEDVWRMTGSELRERRDLLQNGKVTDSLLKKVEAYKGVITPQALWDEIRAQGIDVFGEQDPGYPERLREIADRPAVLYCKGDQAAGRDARIPSIAVIGSRICSEYGRMTASRIGRLSAEMGMELISGMAVGIDGIAQKAALQAGGRVSAVLGSGVDVCYPVENKELYVNLLHKGRILSEYTPQTQPKPQFFPPRNRIISGLADAVIVVEAKEKSGTMITVDMALEQGRQVYIIPGRLTDPLSAGCNRLISEGAQIVWNLSRTLEEIYSQMRYGVTGQIGGTRPWEEARRGEEAKAGREAECRKKDQASPDKVASQSILAALKTRGERIVYEALDYYPRTQQEIYEALAERSDLPFTKMQEILLQMELEGLIGQEGGRFFLTREA